MQDAIKHTTGTVTSAAGFFGWITLHQANEIAGLCCGVAGFIAAMLTIVSWFKKNL